MKQYLYLCDACVPPPEVAPSALQPPTNVCEACGRTWQRVPVQAYRTEDVLEAVVRKLGFRWLEAVFVRMATERTEVPPARETPP